MDAIKTDVSLSSTKPINASRMEFGRESLVAQHFNRPSAQAQNRHRIASEYNLKQLLADWGFHKQGYQVCASSARQIPLGCADSISGIAMN
jgi:hypothetical protein